ncbi:uncharacterized protein LOC141665397 [Apium graveolens]|uniref:uncharacterized protein LOC141665397 n=1 Tax=Apium graveolens TaxID=4045 RepID=UPI003D79E1BF
MDRPPRSILHSPKVIERLIKWEIDLGEFDIKYKPQTSLKAHTLADFTVERTINNQEVGGQEIVTPEEGKKDKEKDLTLKEYWVLYFDRAFKKRSSGATLGLQSPEGFMIEYALKLDYPTMNNKAEYEALIAGLGLDRVVRAKNIKIYGESRLIVAKVNGVFEAENDPIAKYLRVMKGILTQFDEWYAKHVPREENTTSYALSKFTSPEIENYPRSIYFRVPRTPKIHVINLIIPIGLTSYWIDPIKNHLETGWLPDDAQEACNLSVRALKYSLIEGLLYKRSFVIPYLKCLKPLEADEALDEAYMGIFILALGGRALANKIIQLGFYWPRMMDDTKSYMKKREMPEARSYSSTAPREAYIYQV